MAKIQVLSEETIDKIAAGEVIERPASVVKELVENAIDAGADAITVEIKEGGISFIRITDNGCGINREDIPTAFLRHATSKIKNIDDINCIHSLGFRGEALSSISAVAMVELMTKTADAVVGSHYIIEGAKEKEFGEIGVPNGTTIIVRNIFFNTPVRRKFLKSAATEGSYVADVCEHLALSKPNVSIKFVNNGQIKFHTSGSGDLKELIYRIYGKDIAKEIIPIDQNGKDIHVYGYLGTPVLNRSTRNYENYFVNGRYIKSTLISHAVEEGYKAYLMQHKFPFFILNIDIDTTQIDVNVHPTKMDVRFTNGEILSDYLESAINSTLKVHEMIPEAILVEEEAKTEEHFDTFEPFEVSRKEASVTKSYEQDEKPAVPDVNDVLNIRRIIGESFEKKNSLTSDIQKNVIKAENAVIVNTAVQMDMFEDRILSSNAMEDYEIIGQIFDTYWLIGYKDKLMIMDQHAAHEKVRYEALVKKIKDSAVISQNLAPAIVVSLTSTEMSVLSRFKEHFESIGFEIDDFGGNEITIRAVPVEAFGKNPKEMFLDILDELSTGYTRDIPEVICEKLASMACKGAVKGNMSMTKDEVWELLKKLMTLDNPYNCPHGRPTIITMSKNELEKKFKRIV